MTVNPAHDHEFKFGERTYTVRRSFALIRSIEQAFGPLLGLQSRLRDSGATFDELADLILIILKDASRDLDRDEVEETLFQHGHVGPCTEAIKLLVTLFIGDQNLARQTKELAENPQTAAS